MDEPTLRRKLAAIQALHEGATTDGEREAAAEARQRVAQRLVKVTGTRRLHVHAAFRHAADLGPEEPDPLVEEAPELPTVDDLRALLLGWRMGQRSRRELCAWAAHLCDRLLLPSVEVHDPRAARIEVLLQLAAMGRQPLCRADIPAIEAFLLAEPGEAAWRDWFDFLAGIDWDARSRG